MSFLCAMDVNPEYINFFIKTMIGNDFNCADIRNYLVNKWGDENIPCLRQIQYIAADFKQTQRVSVKKKLGSGRPRTVCSPENIEAILLLIEEDNSISLTHISHVMNLDIGIVYRILTKDLNRKSVFAK